MPKERLRRQSNSLQF